MESSVIYIRITSTHSHSSQQGPRQIKRFQAMICKIPGEHAMKAPQDQIAKNADKIAIIQDRCGLVQLLSNKTRNLE